MVAGSQAAATRAAGRKLPDSKRQQQGSPEGTTAALRCCFTSRKTTGAAADRRISRLAVAHRNRSRKATGKQAAGAQKPTKGRCRKWRRTVAGEILSAATISKEEVAGAGGFAGTRSKVGGGRISPSAALGFVWGDCFANRKKRAGDPL